MTTTSQTRYRRSSSRGILAFGVTSFAGVLLATVAIFQILQGVAAIGEDDVFVRGVSYVYELDVTAWGWIHLVLGIIGLVTGIGILAGQTWGRVLGILIAFLGALANFAFIPYYPVWSIVVIAFWVLTLWALCTQLERE